MIVVAAAAATDLIVVVGIGRVVAAVAAVVGVGVTAGEIAVVIADLVAVAVQGSSRVGSGQWPEVRALQTQAQPSARAAAGEAAPVGGAGSVVGHRVQLPRSFQKTCWGLGGARACLQRFCNVRSCQVHMHRQ
jgi:hypothetical protein